VKKRAILSHAPLVALTAGRGVSLIRSDEFTSPFDCICGMGVSPMVLCGRDGLRYPLGVGWILI
jgi:hypothetical protein